jgi:tubulin polyglutamylase TTLL1
LAVSSVHNKLDSNSRTYTFEIFGLDFLIDENLKPWLIEVNCNPCLELSSPLLSVLIPSMLENSLRIAVDPIFPPPEMNDWPNCHKSTCPGQYLESNRYMLLFDSGHKIRNTAQPSNIHLRPSREKETEDASGSSSSNRHY